MAALTTQVITRAGVTPSYAAVSASDTFTGASGVFLHVKNAGGSSDTVAVAVPGQVPAPNLTISSVSVSVTNGQERMIGPFPANFFNDPTTGVATVTHSFQTSVTIGVFNLQQP